ncbi:radical SAM family heme chaperone HemW [Clostridium aciditolerans]|uniref:Heme chaperone HemW n=1 Tax=Clostridium aciditolerans TaxID=339861 RepID=A0A934HW84_9CLOT|nr:radical SAM family heme chaperone HemW [Clostridium aciditolerans]MBI6871712.1 oxygen-independent coproporphyrinogen III oxidase [Clostridium aciditolerans]
MLKNKEIALYIHIPFCKQKCLYCDFPSFCGKEESMIEYSKALEKDIDSINDRVIKTIFIGGGTPTYLSLDAWTNIKKAIDKLDKAENLEFTVEGNPGTFTEEKLKFLREMGVNRLSIGLQAWQNRILKKVGRIHSTDDFIEAYELARKVGFNNINVDLMFGLPDQNMNDLQDTLENVVKLNPEHVSCYSLIIEENTPFYKMYEEDKLNLPNEELEREMYRHVVSFLRQQGYHQYEISNFSKPKRECTHNLVYWNLEEYVGCGVASHSYVDGLRYRKTENIEEYIRDIRMNKNLKLDMHKNSLKDEMEEFMFMGLRKTDGISTIDFSERFQKDIYSVYGEIIKKYINNHMLIKKDDRLFLSKRGIEISNSIMCDFIQ